MVKIGQLETGIAYDSNALHYIKAKLSPFVESLPYIITTMITWNFLNGFTKDYKYVKWLRQTKDDGRTQSDINRPYNIVYHVN